MSDWIQRHEEVGWPVPVIVITGLLSSVTLCRLMEPPGTNVGDPVIRQSAVFAALAWYVGATTAIDQHILGESEPQSVFHWRRWAWTAGCLLTLLHIAVAMHAGHAWSHEAAFRHTEEVSGYGFGIFINYAFAAVWTLDVMAMWVVPDAYRKRPRWLGLAVHGFLAFIVFNATVVFAASPFMRAVSLLLAANLVWMMITRRRRVEGP